MKLEREEEIKNVRDKTGLIDYGKLMRKIGVKERKIDRELVKKYFFCPWSETCAVKFKKFKK